jgi:hypothetical protein
MWSAAVRMSSSLIRVGQQHQPSGSLQLLRVASSSPLPPIHRVVTTARMQICTDTNGIGSDSSMIAANDRSTVDATKKQFCTATSIEEAEEDVTATTSDTSSSSSTAAMEDEYGEMTSEGESYVHPEPFVLESGEILPHATLKYQTYGTLNEAKDNVLVVCHALTGMCRHWITVPLFLHVTCSVVLIFIFCFVQFLRKRIVTYMVGRYAWTGPTV